jgi:SET domain-containing protein
VYAAERITKNSRIIDYAGRRYRCGRARRARGSGRQGPDLVFHDQQPVRARRLGWRQPRAVHQPSQCRPNCYAEVVGDTIWIRASRTIEPGEELTYDYNTGGDAASTAVSPGCDAVI